MNNLSLAEKLVLLAYDDSGKAQLSGTNLDPRTGAPCALVAAVGLDREVFPDLPRKLVKERVDQGVGGRAGRRVAPPTA